MHTGMKYCFLLLLLFLYTILPAQSYKKLHQKAIVADSHNDILTQLVDEHYKFDDNLQGKTHSDLSRMRQGGIDVQVFSVWCDASFGKGEAFKRAIREIDTLYAVTARNPNKMKIVKNYADLQDALQQCAI
jgi:membrane dipeptidase